MSRVIVNCRDFKRGYRHLNGDQVIQVTTLKPRRAILTIGFQSLRQLKGTSMKLWSYRSHIANASTTFLECDRAGVRLAPEYFDRDASEIRGDTYWLGMGFAKLTAEQILDVPWLAQADHLIQSGDILISPGNSRRGDLVGRDTHSRWQVVEAKGRTGSIGPTELEDAKEQAKQITHVFGKRRKTASVCAVSLGYDPLTIVLKDPAAGRATGVVLRGTVGDFFRQYYAGLTFSLQKVGKTQTRRAGNMVFRVAPLSPELLSYLSPRKKPLASPAEGLEIGMPEELMAKPESAPNLLNSARFSEAANRDIGRDGIAIFRR